MTNKEVFIKNLNEANMSHFVDLIIGCGKCNRCSNFFWDGNYTGCHKNMNDSSCEEGIAQYMESRVGENLQVKYHKKYGTFRSYTHAMLGKQLAEILYQAGVVDLIEPPCEWCKSDTPDKRCADCDRFWCNILDMSRRYAVELAKSFDKFHQYEAHEVERKYYGNAMVFISEILISRISEDELKVQAELLVKLINQIYKEVREERKALSEE